MSRQFPSSVLFAVRYPVGRVASQRFRFEQFLRFLEERGVRYECSPFWDERTWTIMYQSGHLLKKFIGLLKGFARRVALLTRLGRYDLVYVHREMTPIGPPVFEWLVSHVFKKELVYDFDDAIWLHNVSEANPFADSFKTYAKVSKICKWATRVSAGNDYLAEYARRYNDDVVIIPTVVDTVGYHNRTREPSEGVPVIGWTGTHSTVDFLRPVVPVIESLSRKTPFEFVVIADRPPDFDLQNLRFVPWNKNTEIDDLLRFDIGIMPIPQTDWARGKCGFKIIQYMALGIPTVASPAGVNSRLIENGVDGYLCDTESEWERALERLLADPGLRRRMGAVARNKAETQYSVTATTDRFLGSIRVK
ncbi:MAG: glycosyltransferase [Candidatus Krumholzibacteria bacterium]|nr:glycosyltransferase [Candidatus Krumholzibacteria bacterium]